MLLLALLAALPSAGAAGAADTLLVRACQSAGKAPSASSAPATRAFLTTVPASVRSGRDTMVVVLCIVSRGGDARFGSYHGELSFDSTAARLVRIEKVGGGMRVENTRRAGYVNFAGAAPEGFAEGPQLGFVVSVARQTPSPSFRLRMLELNSVRGENLMPTLSATAPVPAPRTKPTQPPAPAKQ